MKRQIFLFCLSALLMLGTGRVQSQAVTQDWALHDAGNLIQVVANNGALNKGGLSGYTRLLSSEFPPNSFIEHLGLSGWYLGGIPLDGPHEADTLVSVTNSFNSADEFQGYSSQPWDTVWVAERGDSLHIPYPVPYPNGGAYNPTDTLNGGGYVPVSDEDLITRYNDYNTLSLQAADHRPLYLDVIQASYAWGSPPLDDVVIVNYAIVSTRYNIRDAFFALHIDGLVGYRTGSGFSFSDDDLVKYYPERNMAATLDAPEGPDGGQYSPIGTKLLVPDQQGGEELTWTWLWSERFPVLTPEEDGGRYRQMSSGETLGDRLSPGTLHYILSVGPFDISLDDTLQFTLALVPGVNEEDMLSNEDIVNFSAENRFQLPKAPPLPAFDATTRSGRVILDWTEKAENVETYQDPNRRTTAENPFEGYRVWKSTQGIFGPWTLLAEYDIPGNDYGANTGIPDGHQFTDDGLVNNVEYYYAITAFSKPDTISAGVVWPSQATPKRATAQTVVPGTGPQEKVGQVAVVPNPYRGDIRYQNFNPPWEKPPPSRERWVPQDRRLQFINLPERCEINVYTMSGRLVQTLHHESQTRGYEDWNLTSRTGQAVASGIYLFTVENLENSRAQTGTFVIIK